MMQDPSEGKSKFQSDERFSKGPAFRWSLRKLSQEMFRVPALPCALAEFLTFLNHSCPPATPITLSLAHLVVLLAALFLTVADGIPN